MEVWKDIPGYEGKYQVSNLGNVKSLNYNRQRIEKVLKPYMSKKGYALVRLWHKSQGEGFLVHRIVAELFVSNPYDKAEVNHINGIKTDNRAENLEWCTRSENESHAWRTGLGKHYTREIVQYDLQGNLMKEWGSVRSASCALNISNQNMNACLHGRRKTAGGYIWRYKEAE